MKPYVTELANDIIETNKNNPLMRDDMRKKIENYVNWVLEDCKAGLITDYEAVYLMAREDKF